jgi:hypothetical protein
VTSAKPNFVPLAQRLGALPHVPAPTQGFAPIKSGAPCEAAKEEPKVELVRDGQRVKVIRVTCSCGEVIELQCDY